MSLRAESVSVVRGGRRLLDDISLCVYPGELLVIVGPNGAGKSTLINALAGDLRPSSGQISLNDECAQDIPLWSLATRRAVVSTAPRLAFDFTVRDVVAMSWLHGEHHGRGVFEHALNEVLRDCDLEGLASRVYNSLSSGERQRAEFARACLQLWCKDHAQVARWLLLDEPTSNLDVAHAVMLLEAAARRTHAGEGVVAVLHDLDLAARFADRIALLERGRLLSIGRPEEVLQSRHLSDVYRTAIHVERHPALGRLVVIG